MNKKPRNLDDLKSGMLTYEDAEPVRVRKPAAWPYQRQDIGTRQETARGDGTQQEGTGTAK